MDYETAKKFLRYDSSTGFLFWKAGRRAGHKAGTRTSQGYIRIMLDGKCYQAHRVIFLLLEGCWPPADVDHINGDRADNRRCNLRKATRSENAANRHRPNKNNRSGFIGTHCLRPGKWVAQRTGKGGTRYLGVFDTPEAAAAAYAAAK